MLFFDVKANPAWVSSVKAGSMNECLKFFLTLYYSRESEIKS